MNYREVKCSDRLPEKKGYYKVQYSRGNFSERYYREDDPETDKLWRDRVECWLEPYKPPTKEEIKTLLRNYGHKYYKEAHQGQDYDRIDAEFIPRFLNLLK